MLLNIAKLSKTTRTCTTILDGSTGNMTELIEPAGRVDQHERLVLENTIKDLIQHSPKFDILKRIEGIALCGTLPPGLSGSIYTLVCTKKPKNCLILLDAFQNIECLTTGIIYLTRSSRYIENQF